MNQDTKLQDAKLQAQQQNGVAPSTPPKSIEERYEESRIKFEEGTIIAKQREEELLGKVIDRDAENITLRQDIDELKRNYRLLENRHFSQIKKDITEESRESETDPEKIIQNTFMKVVENKAIEASKNHKNTTYWLV